MSFYLFFKQKVHSDFYVATSLFLNIKVIIFTNIVEHLGHRQDKENGTDLKSGVFTDICNKKMNRALGRGFVLYCRFNVINHTHFL